MKRQITNPRTRLYLVGVVVLLVGLGSALSIYLTADNYSDSSLGYDMAGGNVYPVKPEDSKMFIHDLEVYGGKGNVIANGLVRWLAGLWHGKSLAYTVACITIFVAFGFFLVARHLPPDVKSDARDDYDRAGNG
jgi:hypothetical protein